MKRSGESGWYKEKERRMEGGKEGGREGERKRELDG